MATLSAEFTDAKTKSFFEDKTQMGLATRTVEALKDEDIQTIADLADFDEDDLKAVFKILKDPPKAKNGKDQDPFHISAKSQKRLLVAMQAVKHFVQVGREISPAMMLWSTLRNFEEEYNALQARKEQDEAEVPKLTNGGDVSKWVESMKLHLGSIIGVRDAPLLYLLRETADVSSVSRPKCATNQPHAKEFKTLVAELIAFTSHDHALYTNDNLDLFNRLERAPRGTRYASVLTRFRKDGDGRGTFFALVSQYAGPAVWEKKITACEHVLTKTTWTGTASVALEKYIDSHRSAYTTLTEAAEQVPHKINLPPCRDYQPRSLNPCCYFCYPSG